ncbi:hypothetical protein [Burkholderia ubonensis]|uniref:Uncharacterized protein n=1 Tax=Burkholderia ubonensis TaxID=101571 RepID=A0A1R1J946_9BURK|nr:hypothetical protein [Burkholderia ubonensis]OMG71834.1 hypothetical protein BW685_19360 [Burkholderia ubonensis]
MKQFVRVISVRHDCAARPAHPDAPRCVIDFVPATDVAVFEVDRTRLRWTRVAPAACMRHPGTGAGERVAIHAFTVDVPAPGGAQ